MRILLKYLFLSSFPLLLFSNDIDLHHEFEGTFEKNQKVSPFKGKFYLKAGPATTVVLRDFDKRAGTFINYSPSKKTKFRPVIGLSYRTPDRKNKIISCFDIALSYSYNDLETEKRNYSYGEIFFPKITALHYFNFSKDRSIYIGSGANIFTSWQKETHTKSPSLLSSDDDKIFNTRSFSFVAAGSSAVIGFQKKIDEVYSSGIQLEINTPLHSITTFKKEARTPLSAEISYVLGF
jgi:hypothetical protein